MIFGLFADLPDDIRVLALSGLTLLALAGLCFFARTLKKKDILPRLAVSAIVAGAIGNQLDRILFGEVTDFILFIFGSRAFPAFNLADSCIFLGVCALVFDTFFTGCKAEKEEINVEEKGNKE